MKCSRKKENNFSLPSSFPLTQYPSSVTDSLKLSHLFYYEVSQTHQPTYASFSLFLFAASSISSFPCNSLPVQRLKSKSHLLLLLSIILMWIMRSQEPTSKTKLPWWVEIWARWWVFGHRWLVCIACLMNEFRPRPPFALRFVEKSFSCHLGKPWTQLLKQSQQTKPLFKQLYKLNSPILSQENCLERVTYHSPTAFGICSLPSKVFLEYK